MSALEPSASPGLFEEDAENEPDSAVVQFPYQNDSGVYHYPTALMEEMEQYMMEKLAAYLPAERIFRWKE